MERLITALCSPWIYITWERDISRFIIGVIGIHLIFKRLTFF